MGNGSLEGPAQSSEGTAAPSIRDVVATADIPALIATAKLGYESFGSDQAGSSAFGWNVAAGLAEELQQRSAREAQEEESRGEGEVTLRAQEELLALSKWADAALADRGDEAMLLHRLFKLVEESGEVATAAIGALGANPRKGVTNGLDKVKEELLDVAITALGAYEHLDGNEGTSISELFGKINRVAERAGVAAQVEER